MPGKPQLPRSASPLLVLGIIALLAPLVSRCTPNSKRQDAANPSAACWHADDNARQSPRTDQHFMRIQPRQRKLPTVAAAAPHGSQKRNMKNKQKLRSVTRDTKAQGDGCKLAATFLPTELVFTLISSAHSTHFELLAVRRQFA